MKTHIQNISIDSKSVSLDPQVCVETTMMPGQDLVLTGQSKLQGSEIAANGDLTLTFASGPILVVHNYSPDSGKILAANGSELAIDQAMTAEISPNIDLITMPAENDVKTVSLHDGHTYQFDFNLDDAAATSLEDGVLIVLFDNGSQIIIPNYSEVTQAGSDVSIMLADGSVVSGHEFYDVLATLPGLGDILPAAGEAGLAGGISGGGFGFNSSFTETPLNTIDQVGAIDPTELQYGMFDVAFRNGPDGDARVQNNVGLVVNNSQVEEDGSVPLNIVTSSTDPFEQTTITVTGITPGWTVDTTQSGGTYDPATGTWTLILPAGQDFSGGPLLSPPANSDADLTGLQVTSTVTNSTTGEQTVSTGSISVIVDAVGDAPVLSADDVPDQYWYVQNTGYTVPLHISSQVADNDGSEVITKITIDLNQPFTTPAGTFTSLDSMGVGLNMGTEVSPGLWEIAINNGNADATLQGLALVVPNDQNYAAIHQSVTGGHEVVIPVTSYTQETNLSGGELDTGNNTASSTDNVSLHFYITPLVLDLDGDGIELVGKSAGTMFDMTNDGINDRTTWVGADDGMLALDKNGDGMINNQSELFGNNENAADGFANLKTYDTNNDGKIDANDTVFNDLKIWQDLNQDGISQADEMQGLSDLGIASIGLATTPGNGEAHADGQILMSGSFTYENGQQGQVADALFSVDNGRTLEIEEVLATNDALFAEDPQQPIQPAQAPAQTYDAGAVDVDGITAAAQAQQQTS